MAEGAAPVPYVAWLRLTGNDINRSDLVTTDLDTVQIASAGSLSPIAGATTKFTPLLKSSTEAEMAPAAVLAMGGDPATLLDSFKSAGKSFTLAARVSGPVKSAFPGGPPPVEPDKPDAANPNTPAPPKPDAPLPAYIAQSSRR